MIRGHHESTLSGYHLFLFESSQIYGYHLQDIAFVDDKISLMTGSTVLTR